MNKVCNNELTWQINVSLDRISKWCDKVESKAKENKDNTESLLELRDTTQRLIRILFDEYGRAVTK